MKKFFCLLLTFIPAIAFAKPDEKEQVLIKQGLRLCSIIKEKSTSETYLNLLSSSPEIHDLAHSAGNYKKLKSVFRVVINEKSFFENAGIAFDEKNISEDLMKDFIEKMYNGFPMIINASTGSNQLAVSSVLTTSAVFDTELPFDKCIYIFEYEDSLPICVVYLHGKDKAVSASACILFNENFLNETAGYITIEAVDFNPNM